LKNRLQQQLHKRNERYPLVLVKNVRRLLDLN